MKHWWFSGRMLACHAGDPGSIPGQCNFDNLQYHKFTHVFRFNNVMIAEKSCLNSLLARILHRAPPRLQVDQNFLTQKIVADPKMRCHQKSFGIWRVTEAILGQKTCFFSKNIFWKKFIINLTIFLIFRYAFYRY